MQRSWIKDPLTKARIKIWYDAVNRTPPTEQEVELRFGKKTSTACVYVQRIRARQSFEDFVQGLEDMPAIGKKLAKWGKSLGECNGALK